MKPIIEVQNLSKQYKIGKKHRYLSLRDSVSDFLQGKNRNAERSDFWALNNINFEVQAGESIGIIGRNGAGKSTLLKILSRITPPTKGRAILRGRVASLLEVGTGFHPELSGRENVFMNGSILGLRKAEIKEKFDEIVAFSGVDQFIDTPLKHYSSGMQLRLAFAVAAHLEPEILIIDEVLAVGDAEFQKKCLGKMNDVSHSGRTIIFVSHNLQQIKKLCSKTILLDKGSITQAGFSEDVVAYYLKMGMSSSTQWISDENVEKNPYFHLSNFRLTDSDENLLSDIIDTNISTIYVQIEGFVEIPTLLLNVGFRMTDGEENPLFMSYHTDWDEGKWTYLDKGFHKLRAAIDITHLNEGSYNFDFYLSLHCIRMLFTESDNIRIRFSLLGLRNSSKYFIRRRNYILNPIINWQLLK